MFGRKAREPSASGAADKIESKAALPAERERFACRPYTVVHAGGRENLVAISGAGGAAEVGQELLLLMEQLQSWGTIDEQLARLEAAGIPLSPSELSGSLERIGSIGALWTERELVAALKGQPPRPQCPISNLIWCTRDRGELLARSMESLLAARRTGEPLRINVLDDSADRGGASVRAEIAPSSTDRAGAGNLTYRYIGAGERAEIVHRLAQLAGGRGISSRSIEFILGSGSQASFRVGGNRNLGILLTAGEGYLSADDDTLATAVAGREPEAVALSSEFNPTITDFYLNDEQCAKVAGLEPIDLPAEHARYLGRGVGEIVADARAGVGLTSLRSSFANELVHVPGEVILTAGGVLGDSGLATPRIVFHLDGESRERWIEEPEAYALARLARHVHRRVERPTISSSPWLVTMSHALDNRGLVPPTFPFGRNCDGLLGTMIRLCRPSSYLLQLPVAVRHEAPPRSFTDEDLRGFSGRICDFLTEAAEACPMSRFSRSPEARLQGLAAHFRGLADLPLPYFAEAVRSIWMASANRYVQNLLAQLDRRRYSPPEWAEDIISHIESLLSFLERQGPLVPVELGPSGEPAGGGDEPLERLRAAVGLYGEALESWPLLRELALDPSIQSIGTLAR